MHLNYERMLKAVQNNLNVIVIVINCVEANSLNRPMARSIPQSGLHIALEKFEISLEEF